MSLASEGWGGITAAVSDEVRPCMGPWKDAWWARSEKGLGSVRGWGHTQAGTGGSKLSRVVVPVGGSDQGLTYWNQAS